MELLQRVKELCRYLPSLEGEMRARYCSQMVICSVLVLFRSAFLYASAVQPVLFQGQSASVGVLSVGVLPVGDLPCCFASVASFWAFLNKAIFVD